MFRPCVRAHTAALPSVRKDQQSIPARFSVGRNPGEVLAHDQGVNVVLNVFPKNGEGEVHIVQHNSVTDEIDTLAGYIDWYLQNHTGVPAGEVLVLVNRRVIGNGIRDALNTRVRQNNRPWSAQSFYFEDALSKPAGAEGFSLLTLLVDPELVPHGRLL